MYTVDRHTALTAVAWSMKIYDRNYSFSAARSCEKHKF